MKIKKKFLFLKNCYISSFGEKFYLYGKPFKQSFCVYSSFIILKMLKSEFFLNLNNGKNDF